MVQNRRARRKTNAAAKPAEQRVRAIVFAVVALNLVLIAILAAGRLNLLNISVPSFLENPTEPQNGQTNHASVSYAHADTAQNATVEVKLLSSGTSGSNPLLGGDQPRVLIYHTHTTEAYMPSGDDQYTASGSWRTHDNDQNVVRVGEELAKLLREKYGMNVIHDITDHEPPKLATAYSRSEKTMREYKEKYPSLTLFIDLHRDAHSTDGTKPEDFVEIDGKESARLMFVVGTGKGATGAGFDEMPDFESNYALAKAITERLGNINERLVRDIRVKTGRYNQHISNHCLLVEVGHNANTLSQALAAIPYLAESISYCTQQQMAAEQNGTLDVSATDAQAVWVPSAEG